MEKRKEKAKKEAKKQAIKNLTGGSHSSHNKGSNSSKNYLIGSPPNFLSLMKPLT